MTDPFSISVGALSVVSFGIQICQGLIDYYQAAKDQSKDVQTTVSFLQSLSSTLEGLDGSLKQHRFAPDQLDLVKNVESHIEACEEAIGDLDKELATITRRDKKPSVLESVKKATQAATYPFKKGTLLKLRETIQDVRENLALAVNTLQLDTSSRIQDCVADSSAILTLLRSDIIQQNVRTWLNAPNTFGQHYEACEKRHKDTGLWFVRSQQFQTWLQNKQSFLWLNGFAGSGKTVLASTIIQEVLAHCASTSGIGLAYFYLSYADTPKQTVAGVLSSLLLQISCQSDSTVLSELFSNYLAGSPPDYALVLALQNSMKKFQHTYIVIDALDESPQGPQREALCRVVNQLRQWESIHLLVTSRDYSDIREMLDVPPEHDVSIQNEAVVADIKRYIKEQLRDGSKLRKWKNWHEEIEDALCLGAGGMFRWVDCQFFALKSCLTLNMLRSTLSSLPETLDETYRNMLASIKPELVDFARRVLKLLCFSARPIEVGELIEALAVVVDGDNGGFDAGNKLSGADDLLKICPGMIRILGPATSDYDPPSSERGQGFSELSISRRVWRSDRRIVSLAHFSVREYLVSDYVLRSSPLFYLRPSESHLWISQLCLTYLTMPDIQFPAKLVYPSYWHYGTFDFFVYASTSWSEHARKITSTMSLLPLIHRFRSSPGLKVALLRITSSYLWAAELEAKGRSIMMEALIILVKWLSFEGMADLVDAVLEALETFFPQEAPPDVFPSNQVGRLTTDAQFLARLGSRHQVTASLSDLHALDRSYTYCKDPCTSLALRNSHWDVVNRLISKGFRAYRTPDMRLDPLQIATRDGQHKTVTLMIQAGADFKAYMKGPRLEHPLMLAAANGHAKIISIILAMKIDGADSGLTGPHNVAPLLLAARRGHLDAVRELVKDAKVARIFEDSGDVTLHAGAQRTILDRKTDYGMTALMAAAQFGSLEIVKALVDAGASWKSTIDIDGNSALTHAIKNHHKNVAEWLINKGADIDSPNRFGLTPRELAGRLDTEPIICLVEKPSISTKSSSPKDRLAKPSDNIRARSEESACSKMPWHSRIADDGTLKAALRGTEAPKPLTPTEYVSIRESANSDATSGVHSELESDSSSEFSHEDSDGASDAYSEEEFDGLEAVSGKNSQGRAPPMKRTLSVGDSNKASGNLEAMVAKREMGRAAPVRRALSL